MKRGNVWWLILKEKAGKLHEIQVHHKLVLDLHEYIEFAYCARVKLK